MIFFKFCFLLDRFPQFSALFSGVFRCIYSFIPPQGCCLHGLYCSDQSTSLFRPSFPHSLAPVIPNSSVELHLETESNQVLFFGCLLLLLKLNELLQNLYRCSGSLPCYIRNLLPFKCFPKRTQLYLMTRLFLSIP